MSADTSAERGMRNGTARQSPPTVRECLNAGKVTILFGAVLLLLALLIFCVRAGEAKDMLAAAGAASLGGLIGMFVGFFAHEAKEWNLSAMVGAATVLTGSGTLALLRLAGGGDVHDMWFYPIGLIAGYGFGTIWEVIDPSNVPTELDEPGRSSKEKAK